MQGRIAEVRVVEVVHGEDQRDVVPGEQVDHLVEDGRRHRVEAEVHVQHVQLPDVVAHVLRVEPLRRPPLPGQRRPGRSGIGEYGNEFGVDDGVDVRVPSGNRGEYEHVK